MGVFHVFKIVQMATNRATHHKYAFGSLVSKAKEKRIDEILAINLITKFCQNSHFDLVKSIDTIN